MRKFFLIFSFFISQIYFLNSAIQGNSTNAVFILSKLTDSAKLATLGERGANPRVNKAMYWLWYAEQKGESPQSVIDQALVANHTPAPKATLVEESLLRNWKIALELGIFESTNNLAVLKRGGAPVIMYGPYRGEVTEVDHMIPFAIAPEIGNEFLNLELLPKTLNRRKSDYIGDVELAYGQRLLKAGLISQETFSKIKKARYEMSPSMVLPPPLLPLDEMLEVYHLGTYFEGSSELGYKINLQNS